MSTFYVFQFDESLIRTCGSETLHVAVNTDGTNDIIYNWDASKLVWNADDVFSEIAMSIRALKLYGTMMRPMDLDQILAIGGVLSRMLALGQSEWRTVRTRVASGQQLSYNISACFTVECWSLSNNVVDVYTFLLTEFVVGQLLVIWHCSKHYCACKYCITWLSVIIHHLYWYANRQLFHRYVFCCWSMVSLSVLSVVYLGAADITWFDSRFHGRQSFLP